MTDAAMPPFDDAARLRAVGALETGIAFVQRAGLKIEALEPGLVRLRVPYAPNVNHIGTMYAGALFTAAEIPGGALFLSSFDYRKYFPVVKALNLKFVKPAKTDVTVEVRLSAEEITRLQALATAEGKAEFVLNAEVKDAAGVVVAVSEGIYQLRRL